MKTDKHFRLGKSVKCILGSIDDVNLRAICKTAFIDGVAVETDKTRTKFIMNYDISEKKARQMLVSN